MLKQVGRATDYPAGTEVGAKELEIPEGRASLIWEYEKDIMEQK